MVDADMSYDLTKLPEMAELLSSGADLVLGSRYLKGSDTSNFALHRKFISFVAKTISSINLKVDVSDPETGYGLMRKEIYTKIRPRMKLLGFKFMHEILAFNPNAKIKEVETYFIDREIGKSKFSFKQIILYLKLITLLFVEIHLKPTKEQC